MAQFIAAARKFTVSEGGASLVEYSLLLALVTVACIGSISLMGTTIRDLLNRVSAWSTTVAN